MRTCASLTVVVLSDGTAIIPGEWLRRLHRRLDRQNALLMETNLWIVITVGNLALMRVQGFQADTRDLEAKYNLVFTYATEKYIGVHK